MKERLVELIDQIPEVEKLFHRVGGDPGYLMPATDCIHSNPGFQVWKNEVQLELQEIEDRTNNRFIWNEWILMKGMKHLPRQYFYYRIQKQNGVVIKGYSICIRTKTGNGKDAVLQL